VIKPLYTWSQGILEMSKTAAGQGNLLPHSKGRKWHVIIEIHSTLNKTFLVLLS
jgi:hypothetical protein